VRIPPPPYEPPREPTPGPGRLTWRERRALRRRMKIREDAQILAYSIALGDFGRPRPGHEVVFDVETVWLAQAPLEHTGRLSRKRVQRALDLLVDLGGLEHALIPSERATGGMIWGYRMVLK
jgi:hypothetical protein